MNFFTDFFSGGTASLITAVGDAIDKNVTSDEERKQLDNELAKSNLQYQVQMSTLGLQETEAYLGDTANARDNQSRVQEAKDASWMAKNVQPMLAIGIISLTFFMYWYIVFSGDPKDSVLAQRPEMKDVIIYILGALTTIVTQVVSYFFGSSSGSADKSKTISNMMKKG
jgi:hypothetical protein